jgi:hypothetical protein
MWDEASPPPDAKTLIHEFNKDKILDPKLEVLTPHIGPRLTREEYNKLRTIQ